MEYYSDKNSKNFDKNSKNFSETYRSNTCSTYNSVITYPGIGISGNQETQVLGLGCQEGIHLGETEDSG